MSEHNGGCLCGDLRYKVMGTPEIGAVCHCRYCQLRTGSAFGTLAYFKDENFKITAGKAQGIHFYERKWYAVENILLRYLRDNCLYQIRSKTRINRGNCRHA